MLAEAVAPHCTGPDRVLVGDNAWGLGFGTSDDGYGSGGVDAGGPRVLRALGDLELHVLVLLQVAGAGAVDLGVVREDG
jgi:hypothetical protein